MVLFRTYLISMILLYNSSAVNYSLLAFRTGLKILYVNNKDGEEYQNSSINYNSVRIQTQIECILLRRASKAIQETKMVYRSVSPIDRILKIYPLKPDNKQTVLF